MHIERLIQPPPRTSRTGKLILGAIIIIYSLAAIVQAFRPGAVFLVLVFAMLALVLKEVQAVLPAALAFLLLSVPLLHPLLAGWPWGLLAPAVLFFAAILPLPRVRSRLQWLRPGTIDASTMLLILATVGLSAAALVLWVRVTRPDLSLHLGSLPDLSGWLVPLAGLGFSAGNAALEEALFRGVIMQGTDSAFGPGNLSLLLQGWLFGAVHFLRGFPNGWWGLALAAVFGVMLGLLRRRSRGMAAPWLAHAGADMTIFVILLGRAG